MRGALALLRARPQFRALWAALALSYTGSGAALTVLTLYVQQTHGTGTAVAALLIAGTAPRLLGPLAGSLADRFDLRRLMIGADLGQVAIFGLLALLSAVPGDPGRWWRSPPAWRRPTRQPRRPRCRRWSATTSCCSANSPHRGRRPTSTSRVGPLIGGLLFAAGGAGSGAARSTPRPSSPRRC